MAKYFLSKQAIVDLSEIWAYTCEGWSEAQADKYYQLLVETFEAIAVRPEQGKNYDEISTGILGCRAGRHIIFFRRNGLDIEVIRILHERMDLKKRLEE
jgi:toxin ParE1/3/4